MSSFNHIGDKSAQIASSFVQPTDLLEKGKQAQPMGTIKEMGGRNYIKTATGWKYHGKGTGTKAQEHVAGAKSNKSEEGVQTSPTKLGDFSIGDKVSLKSDIGLISLMDLKGKVLKIISFPKTGLISQPIFVEVEDEKGNRQHLNPDYLTKEGKGTEKIEEKNSKTEEKVFDNKNVKYEITGTNYSYSDQKGGYKDHHKDYLIPILKDVLNKKFKIDGNVEIYSSPGYVNEQTIKFKTEEGENVRIKLRQGTNFGNYGNTHIVKAEMGNKTVSLSYYDSDRNGIEEGENRDNYNKLKEISGENTALYSASNEKVTRYLLNEILKK